MTKKKFLYGNILILPTLQFCGHVHDYFITNAEKVVAFYLLPRQGKVKNFIEVHKKGKLVEKKVVFSPKNIFLTYPVVYLQYLLILFRYFSRREKIYFINSLPVFFFFNSIIRRFRNLHIVYWIQDYWPMNTFEIKIFRWLMHYYHHRCEIALYLTDRINQKFNGQVLKQPKKKTVMFGIKPPERLPKKKPAKLIKICFIGALRESQGIDLLLAAVAKNQTIHLRIIGAGKPSLINQYRKLIKKYKIGRRVDLPNKFYYGEAFYQRVKDRHLGIALYAKDDQTATHYADPGKIKQYTELNLPVIMTDAAQVAQYLKRFKAGIIVKRDVNSINKAIFKIKNNYSQYLSGVQKFNEHFNYQKYYRRAFDILEK